MKKRILYIILGLMLLSNVGVGQTISFVPTGVTTFCYGVSTTKLRISTSVTKWFQLQVAPIGTTSWTNLGAPIQVFAGTPQDVNPYYSSSQSYQIIFSNSLSMTSPTTVNVIININVNPLPDAVVASPQTVCSGTFVSIGSSPIAGNTYSWSSNVGTFSSTISNPSVNPIVTQTYTLTETINATGCSNSNDVAITVNQRPTVNITSSNTTICEGADLLVQMDVVANGNWTITVNDGILNGSGTGQRTFLRSPTSTTTFFIVNAVDENCLSISSDLTGSIFVNVNPTPTVAPIAPQIKCNNIASDVINFSGTVTGTTYAWTNSHSTIGIAASGSGTVTSTTLTNTTSSPIVGIFTVTPTANSCPGPSGTFSITVNPTPTVAPIAPQIKCNNLASDIINFSGTVTGTTYAWTNSQSTIGIAASGSGTISSTTLLNGTASPIVGTITVTPTANSCPGPSGTFSITVNPTPTVAVITPQIKCNSLASDVINFSGTVSGTTYTWTNSQSSIGIAASGSGTITSTTLTNTTASPVIGIFTVTPTANSCPGPSGTFSITVNPTPTVASITPQIKCNNLASDIINFSGTVTGTTYAWTNSQSSIGIAASGSGTISSTTLKNSTTSPIVGTITVTPTANSCTGPAGTFSITVNPTPVKPTLTSPIICEGTLATITGPTGVYTYTWVVPTGVATSTTNTVSTSKAGTYSLTITDANSCTSEVGIGTVTVNSLPTLTITNPAAVCAPGTVDLTATAITAGSTSSLTYSYWNNNTATTSLVNANTISTTGAYYIKGTDTTTKCFKIESVTATVNALPTLTITNPAAVCAPGIVDLTATAITAGSTASLTYSYWTNNIATTSLTNANTISTTGAYYIKGTDTTTKCFKIEPVTATVNDLPTLTITNPAAVCAPGTVDLTATAIIAGSASSLTYSYFTNASATTILTNANTISTTGSYYIKGTNPTTSCFKVEPVTATVNPLPTLTITNPAAVCAPGSVDLTATNITAGSTSSLTYTYFTNASATTSLANANTISTTGSYYIKGTTALNCSDIKAVNATIHPIPTFTISSPSVCLGATLTITANPLSGAKSDYNYTWQVPTGAPIPGNVSSFSATTAGVYTATIKNKITNCESAAVNNNAVFHPLPIPKAIVASDNKVIENKTLNLTAAASGGTSPYTFTWTPSSTMYYSISGQENAVFNAIKEGKVNIKYQVKDVNNCEAISGEYEITINKAAITGSPFPFAVPNAFTPNGDGKNDKFKIIFNNTTGVTLRLQIYNRNGILMFSTSDISKEWDGRYKDVMQDMGIYFVKYRIEIAGGKIYEDTPRLYLLK